MKLIVGLGNPGILYSYTRHNIGSVVVKGLAKAHRKAFRKERAVSALSCRISIGGEEVLLALPLAFMNVSGGVLRGLVEKYALGVSDLLLICDDLDLALGRIKIKPHGSSGGHRGIASCIEALHSEEFARLRVGIGRPQKNEADVSAYVLSFFTGAQKRELKKIIAQAITCSEIWAREGIAASMNMSNQRKTSTKGHQP